MQWFADYLSEIQAQETKREDEARARGEVYERMIDIRLYLTSVSQRKVSPLAACTAHACWIQALTHTCALQEDLSSILFHMGVKAAVRANETVCALSAWCTSDHMACCVRTGRMC